MHRIPAKIWLIILTIFMFCVGIYYDYSSTPQKPDLVINKEELISGIAPDVTFTKINGEQVKLSEFKGKVILLNFWASWCLPCLKEFPSFLNMLDKAPENVILLAVSNDNKLSDITDFEKKFKMLTKREFSHKKMIKIFDDRHKITQDVFGTIKYPETIIISKNGEMIKKYVGGEQAWDDPEMLEAIRVVAEKQ